MRMVADPAVLADSDVGAEVVERVLRERLVTPLFQPIVDLATGAAVGVEALARGPAGTPLQRPDRLFAAAQRTGQLGAMDMLCAERALECALASTVEWPLVFVNAEPAVLDQPLSPRLLQLLLAGLPFRIVLEYTERALSTVPPALLRIAGMSHHLGNGIALDDVGADPMSLAFLPLVEPDVIKLDMHLLRHPYAPATVEVCTVVAATARRTGAMVIAEGVETAADVATARALGAHWGQGWHFGRPAPLAELPRPASWPSAGIRAPRPGLHQPAGSPFEVAEVAGADPGDDAAIMQTLNRMANAVDGERHAVVLGSYCSPDDIAPWRPQLERVAQQALYTAMLRPGDTAEPFPAEGSLVVMTPEYTGALCRRADGKILLTEKRDTVASIGRALLQRLTPSPQ